MAPRKTEDAQEPEDGLVTSESVGRPSKATPVAAGEPEQADAVTGRPNDLQRDQPPAALDNSTFAARAQARQASEKRIAQAKNKAVKADDTEAK